jgi:hypothetical protein
MALRAMTGRAGTDGDARGRGTAYGIDRIFRIFRMSQGKSRSQQDRAAQVDETSLHSGLFHCQNVSHNSR